MSGHRPFNKLRQNMSPERLVKNADSAQAMFLEMALDELRVSPSQRHSVAAEPNPESMPRR
jgi:hypothetical protein